MISARLPYHNRIFLNVIKEAIFPAVLILFVKVITLVYLIKAYDLQYFTTPRGIEFSNFEDFVLANNLSSGITYLVAFSFTSWLVFKAYFLHKTHISPTLSSWLHFQELEYLISGSLLIYIKASIWLVFLWILTLLIFIHITIGLASSWLLYVCLALSSILTILLILDFERDLHLYRKRIFSV